jgi:hypothetical protein
LSFGLDSAPPGSMRGNEFGDGTLCHSTSFFWAVD